VTVVTVLLVEEGGPSIAVRLIFTAELG